MYKVLRLILVHIIIPWVNWRDHLSAESFCYQIAEIQGWFDLQRSVRRAVALVLGHAKVYKFVSFFVEQSYLFGLLTKLGSTLFISAVIVLLASLSL